MARKPVKKEVKNKTHQQNFSIKSIKPLTENKKKYLSLIKKVNIYLMLVLLELEKRTI